MPALLTDLRRQFIEMADRKAVEPYAPALILNVRTYVESLQQVQYLVPSVEVLVVLCQTQTHHFAPHFQVRCFCLGCSHDSMS